MDWEQFDGEDVDWVQVGGKGFAVQVGTFCVADGWATWVAENGYPYGAPVGWIQVVSYQ